MKLRLRFAVMLAFLGCVCAIQPSAAWAADKIRAEDLPKHAMEQSQITAAGSQPFHLRARVVEATNPKNDSYKAEIEEFWVAPNKWKRVVRSAGFSQTLIVNGAKVSEEITGDYPNWLRTLVDALIIPGAPLDGADLTKSSDNPVIGGTQFCRRFAFRAGIPPVGNNVFSTYCFEGGLLARALRPGYRAEYKDYKKFSGKQVARKVREYIEPGTELEASVVELTELTDVNESNFSVPSPSGQLQTVQISEAELRALAVDPPAMRWPLIRSGKASGVLSIYVCLDREGKVREIYALNSDHPLMSDAARKQAANWRFKPSTKNGTPVQVESILTFAYEAKIER